MKLLLDPDLRDLERLSPIVWRATSDTPAFRYDIDRGAGQFVCFFLRITTAGEEPRITFDQDDGSASLTTLSLKPFPFAFYHVPIARIPDGAYLVFHPCTRQDAFHFVAYQTSNALVVAVLHYLFNLRYQKIALVDPNAGGDTSFGARATANIARIAKFFRDVSGGRALRIQEGSGTWSMVRLAMSLKAAEIEPSIEARLSGRERPLISFVAPTYNTPVAYLRDLVGSFALQRAGYVELILSDDGSTARATRDELARLAERARVRVVFNDVNAGIAAATNAGIDVARGDWIAFIDHDDVFVEGAAAVIAQAIADNPAATFFYTDEIIVDAALKPIGAFCKPAYDSVLLSGANYINHFSIFRRDRLEAVGRLRRDCDGSQDYDLLLRYLAGAKPGDVVHIPFLAYLWRREETTYSHRYVDRAIASARSAITARYAAEGKRVTVQPALDKGFHRVRFESVEPNSPVSVVIPNRDSPDLIRRVVGDLLERTAYPVEIVIVDNGSTDAATLAFYAALRRERREVVIHVEPAAFNFAAMCNRGARLSRGEAILFLNNDIEIAEPGWLAEMVECLHYPSAGIVGARLLYPNGKVQHNGVIVGLGEAAGHWYIDAAPDDPGPLARFTVRQTLSAVTAACMMVTRPCFEALGGFDEENFAIAYNDVDLCMRARAAGYRTIWTPFATLIHHESYSRGSDESGANNIRFLAEMARLQTRHGTKTLIDDAFSPFFDRRESRPIIFVPDELPHARANVLP